MFWTLKFQVLPTLEESMGDCWSEWSHLFTYTIQYVVPSLILSSPPWAVGKGMANLEMQEKKSSKPPVCSTQTREENWKPWDTLLHERQKWDTAQEKAAGEAQQMNGVYPYSEVYAHVLAHGGRGSCCHYRAL